MKARNLLVLLAALVFSAPGPAKKPIESLFEGPPVQLGQVLGPQSFVPYKVRKLSRARIVWINFPLLRELGIEIPTEGLTPEWEKRILDAVAWWVPRPSDPEDAFTSEEKTLWADRQGGEGLGDGFGSARAGNAGRAQWKSNGETPLIGPREAGYEQFPNRGTGTLGAGMNAAIWSEVAHSDLPYGSNRVLLIFDPGLVTVWPKNELHGGGVDINGVEVKLAATRPAHYQWAEYGVGPLQESEDARLAENAKLLPKALPLPQGLKPKDDAERVRLGVPELIRRIAEQAGSLDAEKIQKTNWSPSNTLIDGGSLDWDTATAQPGYSRLRNAESPPPFTTREVRETVVREFHEEITRELPPELRKEVPKLSRLNDLYIKTYHHTLGLRLIELSGVPLIWAREWARLPESLRLGEVLAEVATAGSKVRVIVDTVPEPDNLYDLDAILIRLAAKPLASVASTDAFLTADIPNTALRARLAQAYFDYRKLLMARRARDAVSLSAFLKLLETNARTLTRPRTYLRRERLKAWTDGAVSEYRYRGERPAIWNSIDERIRLSRRRFSNSDPYKSVISEFGDRLGTLKGRFLFDARTNRFQTEFIQPLESDGSAVVFGVRLSKESISGSVLKTLSATPFVTTSEKSTVRFVYDGYPLGLDQGLVLVTRDGARVQGPSKAPSASAVREALPAGCELALTPAR